jgi:hypothetical protein
MSDCPRLDRDAPLNRPVHRGDDRSVQDYPHRVHRGGRRIDRRNARGAETLRRTSVDLGAGRRSSPGDQQGLPPARGRLAWLNSDDTYLPGA